MSLASYEDHSSNGNKIERPKSTFAGFQLIILVFPNTSEVRARRSSLAGRLFRCEEPLKIDDGQEVVSECSGGESQRRLRTLVQHQHRRRFIEAKDFASWPKQLDK